MSTARILYGATQLILTGAKVMSDVLFLQAAYNNETDETTLRNLFLINKAVDLVMMISNICTERNDSLAQGFVETAEGLRVLKGITEGISYGVLGSAAAKGCGIASSIYDGLFGMYSSASAHNNCSKPASNSEHYAAVSQAGYTPPDLKDVTGSSDVRIDIAKPG